jgi:MHS family proline/betaine transporter-like MFS transporter
VIEYYDYANFALFITIIMLVITGQDLGASALTSGFIVMFISQLLRPVGGIFFGYFGDKLGRKATLIFAYC